MPQSLLARFGQIYGLNQLASWKITLFSIIHLNNEFTRINKPKKETKVVVAMSGGVDSS